MSPQLHTILFFATTAILSMVMLVLFLAVRVGAVVPGLRQFGIGLLAMLVPALGLLWLGGVVPSHRIPTEVHLVAHALEIAALWLTARALRIFFGVRGSPLGLPLMATFVAFLVASVWHMIKEGGALGLTHLFYLLCWLLLMLDMLRVLWRNRMQGLGVLLLGTTLTALSILIIPNLLWPRLWDAPMPGGTNLFALIFVPVASVSAVMFALERVSQTLGRAARIDPVTGVLHDKAFNAELERAIAQAIYHRRALSLVRVAIQWKTDGSASESPHQINERLATASQTIQNHVRNHDQLGRLNTTEFAVLMEGSRVADAIHAAQRIADALRVAMPPDVTVHAGVVELRSPGETPDGLFYRSAKALKVAQKSADTTVAGA